MYIHKHAYFDSIEAHEHKEWLVHALLMYMRMWTVDEYEVLMYSFQMEEDLHLLLFSGLSIPRYDVISSCEQCMYQTDPLGNVGVRVLVHCFGEKSVFLLCTMFLTNSLQPNIRLSWRFIVIITNFHSIY